jgi:hypothetical protein
LKGLIDSDYVMDNWAKTFVRCWDKLELFIRDYRVECGEPAEVEKGAFQRKDLELFARQCRAFEQEKYGQAAQRHKRLEAGDRRRAWFKGGLYVGLAGLAISSVTSVLLGALVLGWIVFSPPVWVGVQVGIIFAWICLVAGIVLVVRGIKRE